MLKIKKLFLLNLIFLFFCGYLWSTTYDEKKALDEQRQSQQRIQLEEERRSLLQRQKEIEKIRELKKKEALPKELIENIDENTLYVEQIKIEGATLLSKKQIEDINSKYSRKNFSKTDIGNLQTELQNLYISQGYIAARVYMDFNELETGILKFVVCEGIIERIYFKDDKACKLFTAFPFFKDRIFNLRDIEQGLEQMNRLASNYATMDIKPGDSEGKTIVGINNQKSKRFRLNLGVDNYGQKSISEDRASTGLDIDNLFFLNDNLYLNYTQGLNYKDKSAFDSKNYSGNFSLPFGYWLVSANYYNSVYKTTIEGLTGKIQSSGNTTNQTFGIERIFLRGQTYRINSGASFTQKDTESFLNGTKLEVGSRRLVPAEIFVNNSMYLKNGSVSLKLNYTKVLNTSGAKKDVDDIAKGEPRAQYEVFGGNGYIYEKLKFPFLNKPITHQTNLRFQYSEDDLFGSEQFSPSVRGFKDVSISGESGFSVGNDFKTQLTNILPGFNSEKINRILAGCLIGLFYDIGSVKPRTYGKSDLISGWGFTFNYNFLGYVTLSIVYGLKIDNARDAIKEDKSVITASLNTTIALF